MTDTLRSTVKEKLAVGEVVSSMTVRLVPSVEIVQVIKSAGFDSFYIDLEHSPLTIETTNQIATTALAAVDGVDIVIIGTNDLLAELGLPAGDFDNPAIKDAYQRTIDACSKHGKHVGVGGFASRPDLVAEFVEMGARFVSTGTNLNFLLAAAREKVAAVVKLEL
ncbi:MAG: aldolase/citrate lyase family protein [Pseudomonadota bacterium]|nr:aldolase/citrate lyase family protein [Pseudomonadota bacterium]